MAIEEPDQVAEPLDRYAPDVVAGGIDTPDEASQWINAACVPRGIPLVSGELFVTDGMV